MTDIRHVTRQYSLKRIADGREVEPKLWRERDVLGSQEVMSSVVILQTSGCFWAKNSGCSMCGYVQHIGATKHTPQEQIEWLFRRTPPDKFVKIFNSGSFLDVNEVFRKEQRAIVQFFASKGVKKLIIESRPEFVTDDALSNLEEVKKDMSISIAMGLESSNDIVRERYINKGFTFDLYREKAQMVRQAGFDVKTYLLLKPPFLTEHEAYLDCISSIRDSAPISNEISINPMNIQHGTLVDDMFRKGLYRPPWLWSLLKVLVDGQKILMDMGLEKKVRIMSSPTAGGKSRGAHNCGKCDRKVLKMIDDLSFLPYTGSSMKELHEQAEGLFGGCDCTDIWTWEKVAQNVDRYISPEAVFRGR